MIHNPEHRILKMMREIRAFFPHVLIERLPWSRRWHCYVYGIQSHYAVSAKSKKPERCVRQALKQVRKIRGKA